MADLARVLAAAVRRPGQFLFLTGAGISAESGIPTFRGREGYWRAGSRNYHPQELATSSAFRSNPETVWAWYLARRQRCRAASPNAGHESLVRLQQAMPDRFLLITQNVDGLHLRAGSDPHSTYEIHGNLDFMRCTRMCPDSAPVRLPEDESLNTTTELLTATQMALLHCPACGAPARPHVLWFDESYDEGLYRFESSLRAAMHSALLVVIGTTGSTNLPLHIGQLAFERGTPIVAINPEPNPFSKFAQASPNGIYLSGSATEHLPELERCLQTAMNETGET